MKKMIVAACASALLLPAAANAEGYFLSKQGAERRARSWAHDRFPGERTAVWCRPQGRRAPAIGYVYHRWVCGIYLPGMDCGVRVVIIGSSEHNTYWSKRMSGDC